MEVIGIAALALGIISVGSCNGDVTSAILQGRSMEQICKSEAIDYYT